MINALETATQGLLQAERRATDIAKNILKTTSEAASFSAEGGDTASNPSNAAADNNISQPQASSPSTTANTSSHPGFGDLIQQFADLRAEQHAFEASAKAFKAADETLGTLLDDLG